jgi:hypothetical protein
MRTRSLRARVQILAPVNVVYEGHLTCLPHIMRFGLGMLLRHRNHPELVAMTANLRKELTEATE